MICIFKFRTQSCKQILVRYNSEMEFIKGTDSFKPDDKWRGVNINILSANGNTTLYPPVRPSASHTVAVELPITPGVVPKPFRKNSDETWTKNHVHLPFSDKNVIQLDQNNVRKRWELIQETLLRPINNSNELEEAICYYNKKKWKFPALHYLFNRDLEEEETDIFFSQLLPNIVRLALRLPQLLQCGLPLLRCHSNHSITLSQLQIASLLANAFLCTYPRRNSNTPDSQYANFPYINFSRLYQAQSSSVSEKIKCLINYFTRVISKEPTGLVTYSRRYVPVSQLPRWGESRRTLPELFISSEGMIEDQSGLLQVDFANRFVGGGVLGYGAVQEEIRFVICPELLVAQLFTESLNSTEALIISGIERFNKYEGYAGSFTWTGSYMDRTPRDVFGRRLCTVLAIDACNVERNPRVQYLTRAMQRELNKAYVGFSWGGEDPSRAGNTVATGNWGCGAFRGDVQLKSLLQLMAAAQSGASVAYFTFGDAELTRAIYDTYELLRDNRVDVGTLFVLLGRYEPYVKDGNPGVTLYEFLYNTIVVEKYDLAFNQSSPQDPQPDSHSDNVDNMNKRSATSPDLSDIFKTATSSVHTSSSGGLERKSSRSFYASPNSSKRSCDNQGSPNTRGSNRNNVRNCNGTDSYAIIDDMLKEAEQSEREKKIGKRNINSQTISESTGIESDRGIGSVGNRNESSRISVLDEDLSDRNDRAGKMNEEQVERGSKTSPARRNTPIKSSYFSKNQTNDVNSERSPKPNRNETERRHSAPTSECHKNLNNSRVSSRNSCSNALFTTTSKCHKNSSRSNPLESFTGPSCSKDFVIQIEGDMEQSQEKEALNKSVNLNRSKEVDGNEQMDRSPSPDVINSSLADTPVKYTQDLFSEDEEMEVDGEIEEVDRRNKSYQNRHGSNVKSSCKLNKYLNRTQIEINESVDEIVKTVVSGKVFGERTVNSTRKSTSDRTVKANDKSSRNKFSKGVSSNEIAQNTQDIFSEDDETESDSKHKQETSKFCRNEQSQDKGDYSERFNNSRINSTESGSRHNKSPKKTSSNLTESISSHDKPMKAIKMSSNSENRTISNKDATKSSNLFKNHSIQKTSTNMDTNRAIQNTSTNTDKHPSIQSTSTTMDKRHSTRNTSTNETTATHAIGDDLSEDISEDVAGATTPRDSDEVKLFKRIQRNSWADLERSRKDMKGDDLEAEIMDTSDDRAAESPKIRRTESKMKNGKITDYFSKKV